MKFNASAIQHTVIPSRWRQRWTQLRTVVCASLWLTLCATPWNAFAEDDRSQKIDFEDALVEGVNKQPLDSLSQISEKDRKRNEVHLYNKRLGYRTETSELLREMRYIQ